MGYRYVEVKAADPDDFEADLCMGLDLLKREGAEVIGVSMSMMPDSTPENPDRPVMHRVAQVLVWQPDPERRGITLAELQEADRRMKEEESKHGRDR